MTTLLDELVDASNRTILDEQDDGLIVQEFLVIRVFSEQVTAEDVGGEIQLSTIAMHELVSATDSSLSVRIAALLMNDGVMPVDDFIANGAKVYAQVRTEDLAVIDALVASRLQRRNYDEAASLTDEQLSSLTLSRVSQDAFTLTEEIVSMARLVRDMASLLEIDNSIVSSGIAVRVLLMQEELLLADDRTTALLLRREDAVMLLETMIKRLMTVRTMSADVLLHEGTLFIRRHVKVVDEESPAYDTHVFSLVTFVSTIKTVVMKLGVEGAMWLGGKK